MPKRQLLLDESVASRFGCALADHTVRTVVEAGWSGVKNGKLLTPAVAKFDASIDRCARWHFRSLITISIEDLTPRVLLNGEVD